MILNISYNLSIIDGKHPSNLYLTPFTPLKILILNGVIIYTIKYHLYTKRSPHAYA